MVLMKAAEFVFKLILYFIVSSVALFLIERSISAYQRGPEVFDIDSYSFVMAVLFMPLFPVSYTHLRAHETREDLVCRLLLEKKK